MRRVILGCVAWAAAVGCVAASRADEPAKAEEPDAKWLRGKWAFDGEHTRRKHAEDPALKDGLGGLAVGMMKAPMEGMQVRFTDKEVAYLTADGNGKVEPYEVFEVPDASTAILKDKKGKLTAFRKGGDRLWIGTDGSLKVPFYLKPVKPAAEAPAVKP